MHQHHSGTAVLEQTHTRAGLSDWWSTAHAPRTAVAEAQVWAGHRMPWLSRPAHRSARVRTVREWAALEAPFAARRYAGDRTAIRSIASRGREVRPGAFHLPATRRAHALVTAVHATNHTRQGRVKYADRGTGGLALLLAELTGCGALVVVGAPGDANHDAAHPFKDALLDVEPGMEHVVDLHGAVELDGGHVDLGTGHGAVPAAFIESLQHADDLRVSTNAKFSARDPNRVTTFAQRCGLAAVQVEIAAIARPPAVGLPLCQRVLTGLAAALEAFDDARWPQPATDPRMFLPAEEGNSESVPGRRRDIGAGWSIGEWELS